MKRKRKLKPQHSPQQLAADRNQGNGGDMPPTRAPFGGGPPMPQPSPTPEPVRSGMGRTPPVFSQEWGNNWEHQMNAGLMKSDDPVHRQEQFNQQQLQPEGEAPFFSREQRYPRNIEHQATRISPNSSSRNPLRGMPQTSPPAYPRAQLSRTVSRQQLSRESPPSWPELNSFVNNREPSPCHSSNSSFAGSNSNQSCYQQQQVDRSAHTEKHERYTWRQGYQPNETVPMAREPLQPVRSPVQPAGAEECEPTASSNNSVARGAANKVLKVCLKPVGHPEVKLSLEDKLNLEEAILQEVVAIGSKALAEPLRFTNIRFNGTFLKVTCANPTSANWLMRTASSLRFYQGHPIIAMRDKSPQPQKPPNRPNTKFFHATVYFPNSADKSNEYIFGLIDSQNPYSTKLWSVASRKEVGEVVEMVLRIDQGSAADIANDGHKIHYRYGKVNVIGLKKRLAQIFPKGLNNAGAQAKKAAEPVCKKKPKKVAKIKTENVQDVSNSVNNVIDLSFDEDAKLEIKTEDST